MFSSENQFKGLSKYMTNKAINRLVGFVNKSKDNEKIKEALRAIVKLKQIQMKLECVK